MKVLSAFALMLSICAAQAHAQGRKPELVVQAGHADVVMSVAFSPDGLVCATGSRDTTIKLWDTRSGNLLRTLVGHTGRVTKLIFSSDGRALVSESKAGLSNADSDGDNTDRLWQVQTGNLLVTTNIGPHTLSPNGVLYAAADQEGLKIWDAQTGRLVRKFAQASPLATLAFSPDGRLLVASTDMQALDDLSSELDLELQEQEKAPPPKPRDKEAERPGVWVTETGRALFKLDACPAPARFSANGRMIFDGAGHVCSAEDGRLLRDLGGYIVAFEPEGKRVVRWDKQSLDVLDAETGEGQHSFTDYFRISGRTNLNAELEEVAQTLSFSPDGRLLTIWHGNQFEANSRLELWDTGLWQELQVPAERKFVGFKPDGSALLMSHEFETDKADEYPTVFELWDTRSGQLLRQVGSPFPLRIGGAPEADPVFSNDGRWLAVSIAASTQLFALPDAAPTYAFQGSSATVGALAFSPDGRQLAIAKGRLGGADRYELWDTRSGNLTRTFTSPSGAESPARDFVGFSSDGRLLVTGDGRFLDALTGKQARYYAGGIALGGHAYTLLNESNITVRDMATGRLRRRLSMPDTSRIALSPDGSRLAVGLGLVQDAHLKLYDVATGRLLRRFPEVADLVRRLEFSPDGRRLVVTFGSGSGGYAENLLFDVRSGRNLSNFYAKPDSDEAADNKSTFLAFSPDSRIAVLQGKGEGLVDLHAAADGKFVKSLTGGSFSAVSAAFTPDGKILVVGCSDTATRLWSVETGEELANLISFKDGNWLVVTPDGLFDGSPGAWNQMLWRFSDNLFDVAPVEWFFNDFYYPGLIAEILAGRRPKAAQNVAQRDRRQPQIKLTLSDGESDTRHTTRRVTVKIDVLEAPAGAQDVRLFRNGSLVKRWEGDVLKSQSSATLSATIPIVAGTNSLTAYGFNYDNVKSSDATLVVNGSEDLRRQGTTYILAIGVNSYSNPGYNLKYAIADAAEFSAEVKRQQEVLRNEAQVEIMSLYDDEATKANIMQKLAQLVERVQPEDRVIIYFAGHGTAQQNSFYLIPHDLGYAGPRASLNEAGLQSILAHSISDRELEKAFEKIDAGQFLLVIDACNSGQALEAEEKRRGPMNSKGLAQLAYEKGMYILTAAQSYQAAQEASRLGHGYLTYALVVEGLKNGAADDEPKDGTVLLREWLDYATIRVPQMQLAKMKQARDIGLGFSFVEGEAQDLSPEQRSVQRPRVFYRREPEAQPLVVAKTGVPR